MSRYFWKQWHKAQNGPLEVKCELKVYFYKYIMVLSSASFDGRCISAGNISDIPNGPKRTFYKTNLFKKIK